jgi:hypothetical protein
VVRGRQVVPARSDEEIRTPSYLDAVGFAAWLRAS